MMLIRPIQARDLEHLYALSKSAGVGVTTLPANLELLAERIALSEQSFAQNLPVISGNYVFALEDTDIQKVVGVSAIDAHIGTDDVWYNYRISKCVNASKELGVRSVNETLYLNSDLTGCSEMCTLFLDEAYRHGAYRRSDNGRLLSKCRFLFMREHQPLFSAKVIAEMRGCSNAEGRSPFWESLGRKFFQMEFSKADYLSALGNKAYIAELMPKHPIYVSFLSKEAQAAIGQVHENTRPALAMLNKEGFNFNGVVDIFDAGPIVEAFVSNVRAVRESTVHQVLLRNQPFAEDDDAESGSLTAHHLVSNCGMENFRAIMVPSKGVKYDTVAMTEEAAEHLGLEMGDLVRAIPMRYKEN